MGRPGPGQAQRPARGRGRDRGRGSELKAQLVPWMERAQRRVPRLCLTRGTCKDCSKQPLQDSTAIVKFPRAWWGIAIALILEPLEPSHHLQRACGTKYFMYLPSSLLPSTSPRDLEQIHNLDDTLLMRGGHPDCDTC